MNHQRLTEAQLAALVRKHKPRVVSRMDPEQVALKPITEARPRKYRNRRCDLDGMKFDSVKEKRHYISLKWQEEARLITDLRRQVRYRLVVNGVDCGAYVADMVYRDAQGVEHVVDVKGYRKGEAYRLFRLKSALMRAVHGITVEEV